MLSGGGGAPLTAGAGLVRAARLVALERARRVGSDEALLSDDGVVAPRVFPPRRLPRHAVRYLNLQRQLSRACVFFIAFLFLGH